MFVGKENRDSALLETFTTADGTAWRGGVRDKSLASISKRTYGYADLTFGKNDANANVLEGIELPKGFSVEMLALINKPYNGPWNPYFELQPLYRLSKKLSGGKLDAYFMWQHGVKEDYNGYRYGLRWSR